MKELDFNQEEEYFDLAELITEGVDAKVPILVEFPDGRKAKALIKPILTKDLKKISFNFDNPFEVVTEVLKMCLLKSNGDVMSEKLVDDLPAGLPMRIGEKIFDISGIEYNGNNKEFIRKIMEDDLESFP